MLHSLNLYNVPGLGLREIVTCLVCGKVLLDKGNIESHFIYDHPEIERKNYEQRKTVVTASGRVD